MAARAQCEGGGYPMGVCNLKSRGKRVVCPVCKKNLAGIYRALGPRGSCSGYELYVPKHTTEKGGR